MPNDDPPRLKQSRDAPPQLVRALRALQKGADESARLERVARKLGPLLDQPLNLTRLASSAHNNATLMKLFVGGFALLIPALWFALEPSEPTPARTVATQHASSANPPSPAHENENEAPASPRLEPTLAISDTTDQTIATAPVETNRHAHRRATRNIKAHERQPPSAASAATDTWTESPVQRPMQPLAPSEPTPSAESRKPIAPPPTAASSDADASRPAAPAPTPTTEAQLLFDARKAMPNDATRALQLLAEHEKRYPNGQLVPEREVLAIEALRSLGRKVEAEARLHRFEARYPNSFHLERLQH